jgi:hypothetical protein
MALKHTVYDIIETAAIPKTMNDALKIKVDHAIESIKHMAKNQYKGSLADAYDAYMAKSSFGPELKRTIWNTLSKVWK